MSAHTVNVPMTVVPGDAPFSEIAMLDVRLAKYGWNATVSQFLVNGQPRVGKLMTKTDGEIRITLSRPGVITDADAQTAVKSALENAGLARYVLGTYSAKIVQRTEAAAKKLVENAAEAAGSVGKGALKGLGPSVTTGIVVSGLLVAAVVTFVAVAAFRMRV